MDWPESDSAEHSSNKRGIDSPGSFGCGSSPMLELVRDRPGMHLGCLELYVHLVAPHSPDEVAAHRPLSPPCFSVEEDEDERVLVHWRESPEEALQLPRFQRAAGPWRVSCAFAPHHAEALTQTLGREAIDWFWDGLSALVLGLGPWGDLDAAGGWMFGQEGRRHSGFLSFCLDELCSRAAEDPGRYCLGISSWELCGRAASDLLSAGEDGASELRFETVRFETAAEAMDLLDVGGAFGTQADSPSAPTSAGSDAKRGHLFVRVVVFDAHHESLAALHVVQVAGGLSEPESASDFATSLAGDVREMCQLLKAASTGEDVTASESKLCKVLTPLLTGNCKPILCCFVPERPRPAGIAEAQQLLDLAERASLITAQCTRVQGVSCADVQLAEASAVRRKLSLCRRSPLIDNHVKNVEPEITPSAPQDLKVSDQSPPSPMQVLGVGSKADHTVTLPNRTRVGDPERAGCEDLSVSSTKSCLARAFHAWGEGSSTERLGASRRCEGYDSEDLASTASTYTRTTPLFASAEADSWSLAQECQQLQRACAQQRAQNEAKAASRRRELEAATADVAKLREALHSVEDSCAAPSSILEGFRSEIRLLREEAERLRCEGAALSGASGEEARSAARRRTLQALQNEVQKLRKSVPDLAQSEKRAHLVQRCLREVRLRCDIARNRLSETDSEIATLQPAYGELGQKIEEAERKRRWTQEELDKLRRTSASLQAEISHLRDVKGAMEEGPVMEDVTKLSLDNGTTGSGVERFATLQRRLAPVAPHLMPLCERAKADMVELSQSCQRLVERQQWLQQVLASADEADGTGSVSSRAGLGSQRAQSLSRAGSPWSARPSTPQARPSPGSTRASTPRKSRPNESTEVARSTTQTAHALQSRDSAETLQQASLQTPSRDGSVDRYAAPSRSGSVERSRPVPSTAHCRSDSVERCRQSLPRSRSAERYGQAVPSTSRFRADSAESARPSPRSSPQTRSDSVERFREAAQASQTRCDSTERLKLRHATPAGGGTPRRSVVPNISTPRPGSASCRSTPRARSMASPGRRPVPAPNTLSKDRVVPPIVPPRPGRPMSRGSQVHGHVSREHSAERRQFNCDRRGLAK